MLKTGISCYNVSKTIAIVFFNSVWVLFAQTPQRVTSNHLFLTYNYEEVLIFRLTRVNKEGPLVQ
jgi:hypothetical protein